MLSIANVGGSREAGRYYEKADEYYTKDRSPSQWQGKAAEVLCLKGEVKIEDFKNLLDGNLPDGSMIQVNGEGHLGGTDLTFSAPKSVSLQALVGNDHRLIDAHDRAVQKTLEYAETLTLYRQTMNRKTEKIHSNNFAAATFRHELSRACDPQLHTHCVVLNFTEREDGEWRAMHNELFYRQKMLMGAFYRAELARELQQLGYEIRTLNPDGTFELAQYSDQQLEQFSQRSQGIEAALEKQGKSRETATAEEKQIITIATRPQKTHQDLQTLQEYWQEKSREAQIDFKKPIQKHYPSNRLNPAYGIVSFAVEHLIERQAVFKEDHLIRESLQAGVGRTTYSEIQREVERRVKAKTLIRHKERCTTPEAIEREKTILKIESRGRDKHIAILTQNLANKSLESRGLNQGQQQSAELILTSKNQIVGVQGLAGTGKTFMLRAVREIAEKEDFKLIGVAPSAAAAQELSKTGIQSQTITSFQIRQNNDLNSKTLLVVDEAGMVSNKQMEFLLKTVEKYRAKVVLVGDTQQLKAVEAGKPFAQLQDHGMATAGMSEIQRQKDPELKKAVELAAQNKISESITLLKKSISEIKDAPTRYKKIASEYVSLPKEQRDKTLILSGTNEARKIINEQVREGLKIKGSGREIQVLIQKDLTKAQAKQTRNYKPSDFIRPEKDYKSLNLQKGALYKVTEVKTFSITLQKPDGSQIYWQPHKHHKMTVYSQEKRELAAGELIRITQNDRKLGLVNGDRARVLKTDEQKTVQIQREDGKTFKLNTSKPLHLDYGYCSTVHSAQGKTCERVLIEAETKSLTSNRDTYYVAISRARQAAKIFTEDCTKLPEVFKKENVKEMALEVDRKSEYGLNS